MSQIIPDMTASTEEANRVILSSLDGLKPRKARNGLAVVETIASSPTMVGAYNHAIDADDREMAESLRFCSASFIRSYTEGNSELRMAAVVSVFLARREKEYEGPWCQGVLAAMTDIGLIGPDC